MDVKDETSKFRYSPDFPRNRTPQLRYTHQKKVEPIEKKKNDHIDILDCKITDDYFKEKTFENQKNTVTNTLSIFENQKNNVKNTLSIVNNYARYASKVDKFVDKTYTKQAENNFKSSIEVSLYKLKFDQDGLSQDEAAAIEAVRQTQLEINKMNIVDDNFIIDLKIKGTIDQQSDIFSSDIRNDDNRHGKLVNNNRVRVRVIEDISVSSFQQRTVDNYPCGNSPTHAPRPMCQFACILQ